MSTYDLYLRGDSKIRLLDVKSLFKAFDAEHPVVVLGRALSARLTERKYRKTLSSLLKYDDHVLDDIGMTRGELLMALELPLSTSAKMALSQWREERRITG
ncbi:hypothetical protein ADIMK_2907 [Marinobacterium lacunae]|uniref:YjiS-like domain-containing protein n=1 Tax=Marinobacterium lacunae TaxID=1232683 RepID=A0A081FWN2_9GAMM|nr:DUF1127 domain-containing protein [Marinobacterium lacunae]KEA62937.1 hypothetical protein ADIMK_2907 [Marinobacterium lacunae]MBR9884833.1 DUF1127 domain-containing protein [Oceanospirillales bacterium]